MKRRILQRSLCTLALLSCYSLSAASPQPAKNNRDEGTRIEAKRLTEDVSIPLDKNQHFHQCVVAEDKAQDVALVQGRSGYHALKNGLLTVGILSKTQEEQDLVKSLLSDSLYESVLFPQTKIEPKNWRSDVIESRALAYARDYIKDALILTMKGAKKVPFNLNIFDYTQLELEKDVVTFEDNALSAKQQEELYGIVGLLPTVAQTVVQAAAPLAGKIEYPAGTGSYTFTIAPNAVIAAITQEAIKKSTDEKIAAILRAVYMRLTESAVVESYFTTVPSFAFSLTVGNNKNQITVSGASKEAAPLIRTYGPEVGLDKTDYNGTALSTADLSTLAINEKKNPSGLFDNTFEKMPFHCVEAISLVDHWKDLEIEIKCKWLTDQLKAAGDTYHALILAKTGEQWLSIVVYKNKNTVHFFVADSQNYDRREDPVIKKLSLAATAGMTSGKNNEKFPDLINTLKPATGGDVKAPGSEEKPAEAVNYDAPLAAFKIEDRPKIEQYFGGKIPNNVQVHINLLKQAKEQKTQLATGTKVGTKIKNCLLFYGPPGTGKSSVAQLVALMAGWEILFISGGAIRNAYQGSSAAILGALFGEAKKRNKPCVIIIDEIDGTSSKLNPHTSTQEDNRAVKVLITTLDQYRYDPNIRVFCTTNNPENIDPAILRRFTCIEIPLPNYKTRLQILEHYLKENGVVVCEQSDEAIRNNPAAVSPEFLEMLACATNGLSGDALEDIVCQAATHYQQGLEPEDAIELGFRFNGIDWKYKPIIANLSALAQYPFAPLLHVLGGYVNTAMDQHLYGHYKRHMKVKADVERKEKENDPYNRTAKLNWKEKIKAFLWSSATSMHHGVMTSIGGDIAHVAKVKLYKPALTKLGVPKSWLDTPMTNPLSAAFERPEDPQPRIPSPPRNGMGA